MKTLVDWLWHGPPAAHVTDVQVQEVDAAMAGAPAEFIIR